MPKIQCMGLFAFYDLLEDLLMARKLSYKELQNRVKQLEKEPLRRKRAEKALMESEERFRHAFENANIGVCMIGMDRRYLKANHRLCEILGYNEDELRSMTPTDITDPEDVQDIGFIDRGKAGEVEDVVFERRYIHKKGHTIWCQISSSFVRDSKGGPLYLISPVHAKDRNASTAASIQVRGPLRFRTSSSFL